MAAEHVCLLAPVDRSACDEHDSADAVRPTPVARDSWRRLPRCARCGRWIGSPGGAGFGDGKTFCDPCAVRLDFERGDGRPR